VNAGGYAIMPDDGSGRTGHRETGGETFIEVSLAEHLGRNAPVERIAALVDSSLSPGRLVNMPLLTVKSLLPAQRYELSDQKMEQTLRDRILFRRCVGLDLEESELDHSKLSRFRLRQVCRPERGTRAGARSDGDPEASWYRTGGRAHFGYEADLGVGKG